jgi:DNA-binding beta-propeller fold protein YncE
MKRYIFYFLLLWSFVSCKGQQPFGTELLKLQKEIPMPTVKGRIDHMAFNLKDKVLYVAALGNNTVEVIDLNKGTLVKSINGVEEPQGIAYLPEQSEIAVASGGNGNCVFFNGATFERVAEVHLNGDADNIRYDAAERKMYVGYGNGGMALIDPVKHKQIGNVKLTAHPESFQLDKRNNNLYVNLPDDHSIAVIDLKSFTLRDTWKISKYRANFPMTLDTANNLVFIGYRHPAVLVAYNSKNGNQVSTNELVGDIDDIFYYADKQEILASGGDGSINVFKRENGPKFKKVAVIPTREGARTSLLIPSLQTFILAGRANGGKAAAIAVYKIND